MNIIDFFIGALLMNAMPHLVMGLTKTHFLGLFGYSPKGNIAYGLLQLITVVGLYSYNYHLESIIHNGFLAGGLTVLVLFFIFGKFMINFFEKQK